MIIERREYSTVLRLTYFPNMWTFFFLNLDRNPFEMNVLMKFFKVKLMEVFYYELHVCLLGPQKPYKKAPVGSIFPSSKFRDHLCHLTLSLYQLLKY